jgi:hypothetical protein
MAEILPANFFGHGNPMNAVLNISYTEGWRRRIHINGDGAGRRIQALL